jgi:hypothetical protein
MSPRIWALMGWPFFSFYSTFEANKKNSKCTHVRKLFSPLNSTDLKVFRIFLKFYFFKFKFKIFNRVGGNQSEQPPVRTNFTSYHGKPVGPTSI